MVYIDKSKKYLVADTLKELHLFAKKIALSRHYFNDHYRHPHYNLEESYVSDKVIAKGAKIVSLRKLVAIANKLPATDIFEGKIQKHLFKHFQNYLYKLCNTIVFNWESDFFCHSLSGYFIEVEIKISRSDFFADFHKFKHKLFEALYAKNGFTVLITKEYAKGDKIGQYWEPEIVSEYGPYAKYKPWFGKSELNWNREKYNGKDGYWVNDWGKTNMVTIYLFILFNILLKRLIGSVFFN